MSCRSPSLPILLLYLAMHTITQGMDTASLSGMDTPIPHAYMHIRNEHNICDHMQHQQGQRTHLEAVKRRCLCHRVQPRHIPLWRAQRGAGAARAAAARQVGHLRCEVGTTTSFNLDYIQPNAIMPRPTHAIVQLLMSLLYSSAKLS